MSALKQVDSRAYASVRSDAANGYVVTDQDLAYLGLSVADIELLESGTSPLGMTKEAYAQFCQGLLHALNREGVTDADVRLQGSSAHFFSSGYKTLPCSKEEVFEVMLSLDPGIVDRSHLVEASSAALLRQWPPQDARPKRRPFDSMYRAGIDPTPSDYDLQICSDQMMAIVADEIVQRGLDPNRIHITNESYQFVRKSLAERFFLYVSSWCTLASELVQRPVTWALFDLNGPRMASANPLLTSHRRDTDWIIRRGD